MSPIGEEENERNPDSLVHKEKERNLDSIVTHSLLNMTSFSPTSGTFKVENFHPPDIHRVTKNVDVGPFLRR